jgi:hypothetical protein
LVAQRAGILQAVVRRRRACYGLVRIHDCLRTGRYISVSWQNRAGVSASLTTGRNLAAIT